MINDKPMSVKIRKSLQRMLKVTFLGRLIYPFVQKCWRWYIIPKRRQLLQEHGADVLQDIHALMTRNSIPYYCEAGTLLGLMRDKGFIKHDDDIDISIQAETVSPAVVLKIFLDAGYSFLHAFRYEDFITEFTVLNKCGLSIDVFFHKYANRAGYVCAWQPFWDANRSYPIETANSLVEFEFVAPSRLIPYEILGIITMIPENYVAVLESSYGSWQTPDKKYDTVNNRVHRDMPDYAYRIPANEVLEH